MNNKVYYFIKIRKQHCMFCFLFSFLCLIFIFKLNQIGKFFFLVLFVNNYVHAKTWTVFCFAIFIANGTKIRFLFLFFIIYFIYLRFHVNKMLNLCLWFFFACKYALLRFLKFLIVIRVTMFLYILWVYISYFIVYLCLFIFLTLFTN